MVIAKLPLEVERVVSFRCPICNKTYSTQKEAQNCLGRGLDEPVAQVGDIVAIEYGYGWFDGDIRWVINPEVRSAPGPKPSPPARPCPRKKGNCFYQCCTMGFYYVVTAVDCSDEYPHRRRYHVFTRAMTRKDRPMGVFTFGGGGNSPKPVKNPKPFLIHSSKDLIGQKAKFLI